MATAKPKDKKQSLALQLIGTDTVDTGRKPPDTVTPDFFRRLVHHNDPEIAGAMATEQAIHKADQQFGAELTKVRLDSEDVDAAFKISLKLLTERETKLANTNRYIKSGTLHSIGGKDIQDIKWKDWRRKDQVLLSLLIFCLIIASGLGMGNVYANLIASGNAVFIENPWIAIMISALMPIASVSVKFVTNFMTYDSSRRLYAKLIYAATGIAFLFWGGLFGLTHSGVASGINWDSLGEATDFGFAFAFVFSQLMIELLAASALFLAAEDIYMRYSPDVYVDNLEYLELEKSVKEQRAAHEVLREERGQLHGRLVELEAQREAFINEKVVEFISLRARHIATMNAHSDR